MPTTTLTTTDGTGGSGTVGGSTGVAPDFVLSGGTSGFSVTPASQTTVTYTWSGYFTITLLGGAVAPAGGYVFGLGAVNSFGLGGGNFDPGASVTMAAGASSCQFRYMPLWDGTDTITVYPPSGLGSGPVAVSVMGVPVVYPGFTVAPASQSATTGSASGNITVTLTGGAVAPSGGLTFGVGVSARTASASCGASLTISAGAGSATFTVTATADGLVVVSLVPPAGVTGATASVGVTFAGAGITAPLASLASSRYADVDVRCYNADGTRRPMPDFDSISWEIAGRGGMQTGTLQMLVPWEGTGWIGNEWIDVRLWGNSQVLYRGWVRHPQQELNNQERSSPTLHGLYEVLNGFLVKRDFGYTPGVSPSRLFADLVGLYVTRSGRLTGLVVDVTGVDGLGLTLQGMQLTGKSIPQALDALCDLFPNQLIWGGDVDAQGRNRIYLRARATAVKYRFVVGRDVTAFVYPRDCSRIVNRIYVTGAKFDGSQNTNVSFANLLTNASFETGIADNSIEGNVLLNGDFETTDAFGSGDNTWISSGASFSTTTSHGGSGSVLLASSGNSVYQDYLVASAPAGIHAACWWCAPAGVTWSPQIRLELWNGSSMVASSYQTAPTVTETNGYTYFYFQWDWVPGSVACDFVRVTYYLSSTSGNTYLDDCSLWFDGPEQADGWHVGTGSGTLAIATGGAWTSIDWRNRDFTPWDGDVMVKAVASITISGGYAEITTTEKARPKAGANRAYYLQFQVYNPGSSTIHAAVVVRTIKNLVVQSTSAGSSVACLAGAWTAVGISITTGSNCDSLEVGIRALDSATYYFDGAGMWADLAAAPGVYLASDTFAGMRDTSMYSSGAIGVAASQSIATWGEREADVQNDNVIDNTTLDAYAISYFKAMAVPQVQATLRVEDATADIGFVGLDGQVKLLNLPSAPDALTPVRVRYQVGSKIDLDVDLNNERAQMELLFRLVAAGKV